MYVGVKNKNYNTKLEKLHSIEEKILEHYGITPESDNLTCFKCGEEKLGFFIAENRNTDVNDKRKRGYLKCKCWNCSFTGDILDIIKLIDKRFTKKRNSEVIDLLLTEKFFEIKPPVNFNFQTSNYKSKIVKVNKTNTEEEAKGNYIKFNNLCLGNFINYVIKGTGEERNYFLQRGFIEEDFKYLRGYVGIEHQKQEEDFNIIFRCSDFSFIRRYVIPRSKKMRSVFASNKNGEYFYQTPITERHFLSKFGSKTYIINLTFKNIFGVLTYKDCLVNKTKLIRYQNSVLLDKKANYCYLFDMVNTKRTLENNRIIYITEGVFDTLTIKAILKNKCLVFASGGANSNHNLIANKLKTLAEELQEKLKIVLIFDNDEVGEKNSKELTELLKHKYIEVRDLSKKLFQNSKDINEELVRDRKELERRLNIVNEVLKTK